MEQFDRTFPNKGRLFSDLSACGYTTIDLPGDIQSAIASVYAGAYQFFDLPPEVRQRNSLRFGCGYVPFGKEHSGDPEKPDQIDYFAVSARTSDEGLSLPSAQARALHATMMGVFDALHSRCERLVVELASHIGGIGCEEAVLNGLGRWSLLQVHRARTLAPGELINTAHEDGHLLTLAHANGPGLEVEAEDGTFHAIARAPGTVIAMAGSALTLLSDGLIRPLRHRVVAHDYERARLSLLFFADLDPRRCAPWRSGSNNDGVDIGAHVLGNSRRFGVDGFDLE